MQEKKPSKKLALKREKVKELKLKTSLQTGTTVYIPPTMNCSVASGGTAAGSGASSSKGSFNTSSGVGSIGGTGSDGG
jgi:hypothetical protein